MRSAFISTALVLLVSCSQSKPKSVVRPSCEFGDDSTAAIVRSAHCLVLGTEPTAATVSDWAAQLNSRVTSPRGLLIALFESDAGRRAWAADEDAAFVDHVARRLFPGGVA